MRKGFLQKTETAPYITNHLDQKGQKMQKEIRSKKFKAILIAGLCFSLSVAPLNTYARTNRASGVADDAAEVLMEDARESGSEENLYREAVSGQFSAETLEEIIERGYLQSHIDELKVLGYLPQNYGVENSETSGAENESRNVIEGETKGTSTESGQTETLENKSKNSNKNHSTSGNQGSSSTNGSSSAGENHNTGSSTNGTDAGHTSSVNEIDSSATNGNNADQTSSTGTLGINEDAVNAIGDAADANNKTGNNKSEETLDKSDSDDLDTNEFTINAKDIPTEEIRSIKIISKPTDMTYGAAVIQKTDGTLKKVYFDEDWIETQDKTKITYEESEIQIDKETDENTHASFRVKSVILYIAIATALALIALILLTVVKRKEKKEKEKLKNVNF